jgi:SOS-response transcriptional repressor LexA
MSIDCLNSALKTKGLTPTKKFILVVLANYADEKGSCYPSYRHIANIVGLADTKGVQRTIKEFENDGLLKIEPRKSATGQTSNRYVLTLNGGAQTPRGLTTPRGISTHPPGVSQPPYTKEYTKELSIVGDQTINQIAWQEFVQHRKEIKIKLTPGAEKKNLQLLIKLPFGEQQAVVDEAIRNGWRAPHPKKKGGGNGENKQRLSAVDRVRIAGEKRAAKRAAAGKGD